MPIFKKACHSVQVKSGSELIEISRKHPELKMKFGCTRGQCGVCAVKVLEGKENLTKRSKEEAETLLKRGFGPEHRLACQCALNGNVTIG